MIVDALARTGAFVRGLQGWRAWAFAWICGAAGALAFAPFGFTPALLLSVAVLVLLLDGAAMRPKPIRGAALLGWFWGFGGFAAGLYWVGYAFMVDPSAHAWQMPFAIVFLTGGLALFPALGTLIASLFWREGWPRALVLAASFGLTEWLRGHVFTGFPWNLAAYGWDVQAVLQSAAVVGAYGLTLLTVLLGASIAEFFATPFRWRLPLAMAIVFAAIATGGAVRLVETPTTYVAGQNLRIVQPDVPQNEKFKPVFVARNWYRLIDLSRAPSQKPITILVWPEAAPPFLLQREPIAREEIGELTGGKTTLITGAERYEREPELRFFNSLFIYSPRTPQPAIYDKFHLVPFGEYVPFAEFLSQIGITKITAGEAGFSFGDGPHTYALLGAPSVGPLICYEILFPGAVVGNKRPGWFVNVTDDSWFGPSTGPYQHLLTARVRAIEEGVPVVRAANTGISAVIDPLGRTKATLALDKTGALDAPLPAAVAPTPYARVGDLGFWLLLFASGAAGTLFRRK
jgi:apolipoprotein N-acyltransferase